MRPFILALGLLTGYALTPATWDCQTCPAGTASVVVTATGANGDIQTLTQPMTFPAASFTADLTNLYAQGYTVRATTRYTDGRLFASQPLTLTGTVPLPSPTPTPTPTPQPGQFPIGSRVQTNASINIRDAAGALLGTQPLGAQGTVLAGPVTSGVDVKYEINFDTGVDGFADQVRLQAIAGPTPTPTPTPSPTPSPTPTPSPVPTVDLSANSLTALAQIVSSAIQSNYQQIAAQLNAILAAVSQPPQPTCPATISGVSTPYANGDYRFTVRTSPGCLAAPVTGRAILIVK